jgi:hypothetical protein
MDGGECDSRAFIRRDAAEPVLGLRLCADPLAALRIRFFLKVGVWTSGFYSGALSTLMVRRVSAVSNHEALVRFILQGASKNDASQPRNLTP